MNTKRNGPLAPDCILNCCNFFRRYSFPLTYANSIINIANSRNLSTKRDIVDLFGKFISGSFKWARMKIMLNNEDTLRFRLCENFAWNFFRTCHTKIMIKSQHQHKIRGQVCGIRFKNVQDEVRMSESSPTNGIGSLCAHLPRVLC